MSVLATSCGVKGCVEDEGLARTRAQGATTLSSVHVKLGRSRLTFISED